MEAHESEKQTKKQIEKVENKSTEPHKERFRLKWGKETTKDVRKTSSKPIWSIMWNYGI